MNLVCKNSPGLWTTASSRNFRCIYALFTFLFRISVFYSVFCCAYIFFLWNEYCDVCTLQLLQKVLVFKLTMNKQRVQSSLRMTWRRTAIIHVYRRKFKEIKDLVVETRLYTWVTIVEYGIVLLIRFRNWFGFVQLLAIQETQKLNAEISFWLRFEEGLVGFHLHGDYFEIKLIYENTENSVFL